VVENPAQIEAVDGAIVTAGAGFEIAITGSLPAGSRHVPT